jgi:hypothetical protein
VLKWVYKAWNLVPAGKAITVCKVYAQRANVDFLEATLENGLALAKHVRQTCLLYYQAAKTSLLAFVQPVTNSCKVIVS